MADLQALKKLLAEEYGITTARELDEAMKKIGGWRRSSQPENMWCRLLGIRWFCGPCPADRPTSSMGMNTTTT